MMQPKNPLMKVYKNMKANNLSGRSPGGKRQKLSEVLPLETPYVLQVFPIYMCNFKCKYCHFSVDNAKKQFVTDEKKMDLKFYKKIVDGAADFPQKIKTLRFVGMGEPTLHKNLSEMISYAKKANVAEKVELLSNGSLLSNDLADHIVDTGLDRLVISLQGISKESYKEICGFDIDFNQFISNLTYLYENRKQVHIYIKIVDCALEENEEEQFFSMFGDICDSIAIEKAVPIFDGAQMNGQLEFSSKKTQFDTELLETSICPQPFYTMQVNPDGKVVGCHSIPYPQILGDCNESTICDIWNSKRFNQFRFDMLSGYKGVTKVCEECNIMQYRLMPEDKIEYSERLENHYRENQ